MKNNTRLVYDTKNIDNDTWDLLKLVVVERYRFREELLNINGFEEKLNNVTYDMVIEYLEALKEEYNSLEELQDSESLVLIFNYLIEKGLHSLDSSEVLYAIKI